VFATIGHFTVGHIARLGGVDEDDDGSQQYFSAGRYGNCGRYVVVATDINDRTRRIYAGMPVRRAVPVRGTFGGGDVAAAEVIVVVVAIFGKRSECVTVLLPTRLYPLGMSEFRMVNSLLLDLSRRSSRNGIRRRDRSLQETRPRPVLDSTRRSSRPMEAAE